MIVGLVGGPNLLGTRASFKDDKYKELNLSIDLRACGLIKLAIRTEMYLNP